MVQGVSTEHNLPVQQQVGRLIPTKKPIAGQRRDRPHAQYRKVLRNGKNKGRQSMIIFPSLQEVVERW